MSLSVIIITKNEEANLQACLESVSFADQWVVVDSGSSDNTRAIAAAFGAEVTQTQTWPGFGPQKNLALSLATTTAGNTPDRDAVEDFPSST